MIRKTAIVVASGAVVLAGGAAAVAATTTSSGAVTYHGCERTSNNREIFDVYSTKTPKCPSGAWQITFDSQGRTGATGPSGVVATSSQNLVGSTAVSVATGGSFTANKTTVGTVKLGAGTYLVDVNFKATPNEVTTGDVFPSLYVYNGAQLSDFSNDLFNVGSGALEDPTSTEVSDGDLIDSYFSGSGEITVPSGGETLDVYAFGYDSDQGSGTYNLDTAVVTVTQLNTGS